MERQEIDALQRRLVQVQRLLRLVVVGWALTGVLVVMVARGFGIARYQVVPIGEGAVVRVDRVTGQLRYCTAVDCPWDISDDVSSPPRPTRPAPVPTSTWWMGPFDSQAACDGARDADWFIQLVGRCERRSAPTPAWWMGPFDSQTACDNAHRAPTHERDWFASVRRRCERR